jgi:hypothetical protein
MTTPNAACLKPVVGRTHGWHLASHPPGMTPECAVSPLPYSAGDHLQRCLPQAWCPTLQVSTPDYPDVPPRTINVTIRGCRAGEYQSDVGCTRCPPLQYSFRAGAASCNLCNRDVQCYGGATFTPLAGFWHRAADSDKVRRQSEPNPCLRKSILYWPQIFCAPKCLRNQIREFPSNTTCVDTMYCGLQRSFPHTIVDLYRSFRTNSCTRLS